MEPIQLDEYQKSELIRIKATIPGLQDNVRAAVAEYEEEKPFFEESRKESMPMQQEEVLVLQRVGHARDALQIARAEIACFQKGTHLRKTLDVTQSSLQVRFETMLADRTREEMGPLDYLED